MMDRALVLLSGGLDSAVCLALAVEKLGKNNVGALQIYYGQKHDKELECAREIASHFGTELLSLDLSFVFDTSSCTLLKGRSEVPKGSYDEQISREGQISTYVPFRNGLFLASAASFALSKSYTQIYYGAHRGDAGQDAYPDCSQEFFSAMSEAVFLGSGGALKLYAPFINSAKKDIVAEGVRLRVPFEITWSCYEGLDMPCGKCGTCLDREAAFKENNLTDPLLDKRKSYV